ncbi:hypothetical protein CsSME_00051997 [Camellia sinensis var. sinensis]
MESRLARRAMTFDSPFSFFSFRYFLSFRIPPPLWVADLKPTPILLFGPMLWIVQI